MAVVFPSGFSLEKLKKSHPRSAFCSGEDEVDNWLKRSARQAQDKHLSTTHVLLDEKGGIAGYYTLAIGQVAFDELPDDIRRKLPGTMLPVITLAWLGVDRSHQGQGLGKRLLAQAMLHCLSSGEQVSFIAVILDCLSENAKRFYQQFNFHELPGHPMKLVLPWRHLEAMFSSRAQ